MCDNSAGSPHGTEPWPPTSCLLYANRMAPCAYTVRPAPGARSPHDRISANRPERFPFRSRRQRRERNASDHAVGTRQIGFRSMGRGGETCRALTGNGYAEDHRNARCCAQWTLSRRSDDEHGGEPGRATASCIRSETQVDIVGRRNVSRRRTADVVFFDAARTSQVDYLPIDGAVPGDRHLQITHRRLATISGEIGGAERSSSPTEWRSPRPPGRWPAHINKCAKLMTRS
jgi:hypothetical protein